MWLDRLSGNKLNKSNSVQATKSLNQPVRKTILTKQRYGISRIKRRIIKASKKADACEKGYAMGLRANSKSDLLKAITANWVWILRDAKIIDAPFLDEHFTQEELNEAGIYTQKIHVVRSISAFAYGSATVKAYDSATVKAYDNSYTENCTEKEIFPLSDYAIVKDYYKHKIYIKKSQFEIIEVE